MKLPDIPPDWSWKRLKYVADLQTGITLGKDYGSRATTLRPYLRVANVQDGYLDLETVTELAVPADEASRCELRAGDVLMTEGGDFDKLGRGYVWRGQIPGCLHQNHIFAVRPHQRDLNPHFLSAVIASHHGKAYFTSTSQQTTNLACTNSTKIREFPIPLPPLYLQNRLLGHLNREMAKIDSLIEKKERLIVLLEEKRSTLTTRAVTKGLDPSVPLRDSCVSLGLVPAHWQERKLGYMARMVGGSTPDKGNSAYWQGDIPWVSPKDMKAAAITGSADHLSEVAVRQCGMRMLPPRTVLIVVRGMILAHTFPVGLTTVPVTINQDMKALLPSPDCTPEFLAQVLRGTSNNVLALVEDSAHGTKCLRTDLWRGVRLYLPPLAEQREICAWVAATASGFDTVIDKIRKQLTKLQEYRAALISAAVTGKIDVRESAKV